MGRPFSRNSPHRLKALVVTAMKGVTDAPGALRDSQRRLPARVSFGLNEIRLLTVLECRCPSLAIETADLGITANVSFKYSAFYRRLNGTLGHSKLMAAWFFES